MMSRSKGDYPNRLYNSVKIRSMIKSRWGEVWEVVNNREKSSLLREEV